MIHEQQPAFCFLYVVAPGGQCRGAAGAENLHLAAGRLLPQIKDLNAAVDS